MPRPYSMDLRERVIGAVIKGEMSCNRAAAHFDVAISTAVRWVAEFRKNGTMEPGQMGGHKPRAIRGEHRTWLIARCRSADFTLRGLVAELAERGLKVDYHSVWDFVKAEGLSYKKNGARRRTGPPRRSPQAGPMEAPPRQS